MNKTDVGGVPVTLEEIQQARHKLATTGGTAIKQVLAAISNPLASCDYWGEINAALAKHPGMKIASQTKSNPARHAKTVFDFVLASKEATLSGSGQAAPDTADDAYTPPPRGGEVPKSRVFKTDPDKIDRGTKAHKDTQDAMAEALRKAGLKPRSQKSGDPEFDIAWRDDDTGGGAFICEVKSLTDENETRQIRLAIGQVLDYVHTLDSLREADSLPPHWEGVHAVRAVVAVERRPAEDVRWTGLCEKRGIILTWPEKYADTLAALASSGLCDTESALPVTLTSRTGKTPSSRRAGPDPTRQRYVSHQRGRPLVTIVPFPAPPAGTPASGEIVTAAVDRYLDSIKTKTTRSSYAGTLARLVSRAGGRDTASLLPEDYAAVMDRWDDAAAATWNRHLSALASFTAWAGRQEILTANPARRLERRKPARRSDRAIPRARLDKLLTDDRHGLRERVLWRMLYETAARAEELLSLNIEDLDLEFRRGRVTSKGGAIEYVHWATGTARLLPRLLRGRTSGPVFLAGRRAPVSGSRAPAEADVCPETGRGRLSYPRAEYLFKQATAAHDPHEKGWTLHQLRHSALQHLAADGRTAPELQAKSRHLHLGSLGRYVQLGEQTSAQVTADADPAARRRTR